MRVYKTDNGLMVRAFAGITGVLLAFNFTDDNNRKGLLGFALERKKQGEAAFNWLSGMLDFPGKQHTPGQLIATNQAPIQKFRWSDYTVSPATTYMYRVHPVYGDPNKLPLDVRNGAEVAVTTEAWDIPSILDKPGQHQVLFNRAAGASQAFSRDFAADDQKLTDALKKQKGKKPGTKKLPTPSDAALAWLSRGVKEGIIEFLGQAKDASYAADIAIYQYELPDIVNAVNAADERGANVRLIYHAKPGDKQTTKNAASAKALPASDKVPRKTQAIFHHKFIVLSKMAGGKRNPVAVLAGSTNFTFNGVYCQANDIYLSTDSGVAQKYLDQFERIFAGETVQQTKARDTAQNVLNPSVDLQVGFSPRAGRKDLTCFISLINSAKQDVLFSTAFNLDQSIYDALLGQPHDSVLRYGIQDKAGKVTGVHADRTADFEAAAMLPKGLDGWLNEQRVKGQTGNILIHTKAIVVDFTSEAPIVINGSHNFSNNASANNDENYEIFRGNIALADVFACEIMRIFDHYRFRFVTAGQAKKSKTKPPHLTPDDGWTDDYYDRTKLKFADRLVFSGTVDNQDAGAEVRSQKPRAISVQKLRG